VFDLLNKLEEATAVRESETTPKEFREILNKRWFGHFEHKRVGGPRRGGFGSISRQYGDYLYFQDRDMFNDMLRRYNEGEDIGNPLVGEVKKVVEATATDIRRKQQSIKRLFPDFDAKTKGVEDKGGIRLDHQDIETWKFRLHSGTDGDLWYDGYLHFKNVIPTLAILVGDKRLWVADGSRVDLSKLAKEFMDKVEIQLLCSCPSDLYWGSHYIRSLGKYDAKYTKRELRRPGVRNPREYGCLCKHLDRLVYALPFYISACAKWLRDFHGKDIARLEAEAKKKYTWLKKIVRALRRRKEEPEVREPVEVKGEEAKESRVNEMQTIGYIVVDDEKVKLLARPTKYGKALKIRKSGADGVHFEDEEIFLSENPDLMKRLISGEVISV